MTTPTVTSWTGTVTDIGPLYPFVGTEFLLVLVAFVVWLLWHVLQLRTESQEYQNDAQELRTKGVLKHALERES